MRSRLIYRQLSGFIKTPIEHTSIVDKPQTESFCIKKTLPAVYKRLEDIIEPMEGNQSYDLEPDRVDNSWRDVQDIPRHNSEDSNPEGDVPLMMSKTGVDEELEVSMNKRRSVEGTNLEPDNADNSWRDVQDIPRHNSEDSNPEGDVPLMMSKTGVDEELEVSMNKRRAVEGTNLEPDNADNSWRDVQDIPRHNFEDLNPEGDVPLMMSKTGVDEELEVSKNKRRAVEGTNLEPDNADNSWRDVQDIPQHNSEDSNPEGDVPLMMSKTGVDEELEVSKNTRRAVEGTRVSVTKKPKLATRRTKLEDTMTAELRNNERSNLKAIRKSQTGNKSYKCNVCQRSFSQKSDLTNHIRTHTGEKPYECNLCQRRFSVKHNLRNHIGTHNGEKPHKCEVCQRSFSRKNDLTKHTRIHTGEKPYKCDVCQSSFNQKTHLTSHRRKHNVDKPYKCEVCQRSFMQKTYLTRHMGIHNDENHYKCNVCKRSFNIRDHLTKHIRIHTGERPYKCNVCQRSFKEKGALKNHSRIHTGEKPYKCDICKRSFIQKINLITHLRKHTGEKPYECDVCAKKFGEESALKIHLISHTDEQPYKCYICQRSYIQKLALTIHLRKHTGEKPYECDTCQRCFSQKTDLSKHIRIHTGEKPHKCDVCERGFTQKRTLYNHIKLHTGLLLSMSSAVPAKDFGEGHTEP